MNTEKEMSFEEALAGLEKSANALKQNNGSLADAMKQYEAGAVYYDRCMAMLQEAKQQIELYDKELGKTKEF